MKQACFQTSPTQRQLQNFFSLSKRQNNRVHLKSRILRKRILSCADSTVRAFTNRKSMINTTRGRGRWSLPSRPDSVYGCERRRSVCGPNISFSLLPAPAAHCSGTGVLLHQRRLNQAGNLQARIQDSAHSVVETSSHVGLEISFAAHRRGSRILVRGAQRSFDPKGGPEPKICSK